MAVADKKGSPGWATWVFVGALLAIFLGERVLAHLDGVHWLLTGGGLVAALASTALRVLGWTSSDGDRRRVERLFLLGHLGCLVALGLYALSTDWGADKLSDDQVAYAASDVLHLHALRERLEAMLVRERRDHLAKAAMEVLPHRALLDVGGWEDMDIFAHA